MTCTELICLFITRDLTGVIFSNYVIARFHCNVIAPCTINSHLNAFAATSNFLQKPRESAEPDAYKRNEKLRKEHKRQRQESTFPGKFRFRYVGQLTPGNNYATIPARLDAVTPR